MTRIFCAAFSLVALLAYAHAAPPKDLVQDALDEYDKQIQTAKKQFDTAAVRAMEGAVKRLVISGDAAVKAKNDEAAQRAFKEVLRLDRNNPKARDFFTAKNNLDQVLTELTLDWRPVVLPTDPGWEKTTAFECLLGRYRNDASTFSAAVTLAVPDGTNIFSDDCRHRITVSAMGDATNGKVTYYEGQGYFVAPKDGSYVLRGAARRIDIDGKEVAKELQSAKSEEIALKQGKHSISVLADAQYYTRASIIILDSKTGTRIPIFNTLDDIKLFLRPATEPANVKRVDISRWSPEAAKPLRVGVQ